MQETILSLVGDFGYFGITMFIFIENIFPPIPSEAVLLFGGYITLHTELNPWFVILAATIGSVCGAAVLYLLGYLLGKERIGKLLGSKLGVRLGFKENSIDKAEQWFKKYEYNAVLICRCIPVVRSVISIPAGLAKMKFLPFITLTLIGSGVWNTVLVWLGVLAGDAWGKAAQALGVYSKVILAVLAVLVCVFTFVFIKKRRKKEDA